MQGKKIIPSPQLPQANEKQYSKLQLSTNKRHERSELNLKTLQNNLDKKNHLKLQKIIQLKLTEVETQNKRLLDIANRINNSTLVFSSDDKLHQLILGIEEQMKSAFNELIESIQEFYIDIDNKIKQIGSYLATMSGIETLQTSSQYHEDFVFPVVSQQQKQQILINEQQTLRSINERIQMLQKDLQQTKSNQKKLMTIIQKLVQKYELNHETTIVKQEPLLKRKIQNDMAKLQMSQYNPMIPHKIQTASLQNSVRLLEANTFANAKNYIPSQTHNTNALSVSNAFKKQQHPQRIVHHTHNPNDYSICHQLNKIQDQNFKRHNMPKQNSFVVDTNQNLHIKKQALFNAAQKYCGSAVSVQSYAYSNTSSQESESQCFIRKLYSKNPSTMNKVSLKGSQQGNNFFNFNKPKEQIIDQGNKNHREAYLISQLKRIN